MLASARKSSSASSTTRCPGPASNLYGTARWTEGVALGLLLAVMLLLMAPTSFHHIAQHGEATTRQLQFNELMIGWALLPSRWHSAPTCSWPPSGRWASRSQ